MVTKTKFLNDVALQKWDNKVKHTISPKPIIATRHKPNPRKKIKQNKVAIVSTFAMTKPHPTLLTVLSTNTLKKLNIFKTSQKQDKKNKGGFNPSQKYVC